VPTRRDHAGLFLILLLALAMRVGYLETMGHNDLIVYNLAWAQSIREYGLFQVYADQETANYPPLYMTLLGMISLFSPLNESNPSTLVFFKLLPLLGELALLAVIYYLLHPRPILYWFIPFILAVHPGLIATTAFWGQVDALLVLLLTLSLFALNHSRPLLSVAFFVLALLTKFQAVVLLPILVVLGVRRYGWRKTFILGVAGLSIIFVFILPFALGSGWTNALRPYFGAVDTYPATTVNAFNLWHVLNPLNWMSHPPLIFEMISDGQPVFGPFTAKHLGLALLAGYTLILCSIMWKRYRESREFVWATAMYVGFFMLPTQIHERYLLPAVVFSLIAVAQERRLWPVALGLSLTYTYNVIVPTHAPFYWFDSNLLFVFGDVSLYIALLNIILLVLCIGIVIDRWRKFALIPGLAAIGVFVVAGFSIIEPDRLPAAATPLNARLGDALALEGYMLDKQATEWIVTLYWRALAHTNDDYTIFVHADGSNNQRLSQKDEKPQGGAYPTWRWYHNRLVVTEHVLALPEEPISTIYTGLYLPDTLQNLPVNQNGQLMPDARAVVCNNNCR
jgi:Gpi18-like mannosyltransferase